MDTPPFIRCAKKLEGKFQCAEMASPKSRYCQKHYLEIKRREEMRKEDGGSASTNTCGNIMGAQSAEIGKTKLFNRLEERGELPEGSHDGFLTRGVVGKRKGFLSHGSKKGKLKPDEGNETVGNMKTGEKKRCFRELNRNFTGSSGAEKSSSGRRKQASLISKCKDSGGMVGKVESTGYLEWSPVGALDSCPA